MTDVLIINPTSGGGEVSDAVVEWADERGWDVRRTESAGDAERFAAEIDEPEALVVGAGGDGTLHEVVNGLMQVDMERRPNFGVIPLGTANDFCRTLGLPGDDWQAAAEAVERDHARPIDVIRCELGEDVRHCLNVATAGLAAAMTEALTDELKQTWGPLAYVRGAAEVVGEVEPFAVEIEADGDSIGSLDALNLVFANGRYAGGGLRVAPQSSLDDGQLTLVAFIGQDLLAQTEAALRLMIEDWTQSEFVKVVKAHRVTWRSDPAIPISLDGEKVGRHSGPMTFEVAAGALRVVRGASD